MFFRAYDFMDIARLGGPCNSCAVSYHYNTKNCSAVRWLARLLILDERNMKYPASLGLQINLLTSSPSSSPI